MMRFAQQIFITSCFCFASLLLIEKVCTEKAQSAEENQTQQTIRIGMVGKPTHFHPYLQPHPSKNYILYTLMRPIFMIGSSWQWRCELCKTIPTLSNDLIKSYSVSKYATTLAITMEIKDKIFWGDGVQVTAKDVVFSWKVINYLWEQGLSPFNLMSIRQIALDPSNALRFTLIYSGAENHLEDFGNFFLLSEHLEGEVWKKNKDEIGFYEKNSNYITNPTHLGLYYGPYIVKAMSHNSVVVSANPYFVKHPKTKEIQFNVYDNFKDLKQDIDKVAFHLVSEDSSYAISQENLEEVLKTNGNYQIISGDHNYFEHVEINLRNPILSNLEIRKAMFLGIDREKISQSIYQNHIVPAFHLFHPRHPSYIDKSSLFKYDPKKAEELLEHNKWYKDESGFRKKEGEKLFFELNVFNQSAKRVRLAKALKENWEKIGIEVEVKEYSTSSSFSELVSKIKYKSLALFSWNFPYPHSYTNILGVKNIPTVKNNYFGQNTNAWINGNVEKSLSELRKTFSDAKRKNLEHLILEEYVKNLPSIPLFFHKKFALAQKKLHGVSILGLNYPSTAEAEIWSIKD